MTGLTLTLGPTGRVNFGVQAGSAQCVPRAGAGAVEDFDKAELLRVPGVIRNGSPGQSFVELDMGPGDDIPLKEALRVVVRRSAVSASQLLILHQPLDRRESTVTANQSG